VCMCARSVYTQTHIHRSTHLKPTAKKKDNKNIQKHTPKTHSKKKRPKKNLKGAVVYDIKNHIVMFWRGGRSAVPSSTRLV
jgi:hypothetical protein